MQLEHCKEMLNLELSILRPKRILFLTGTKHAQDFLNLSGYSGLENCVCPLGDYDYEFDKINTVVSVHPKKYHRKELCINSIEMSVLKTL
jgi:uracil-DNA glycosylase